MFVEFVFVEVAAREFDSEPAELSSRSSWGASMFSAGVMSVTHTACNPFSSSIVGLV